MDELRTTSGLDADHFDISVVAPDIYLISIIHHVDPKLGDYRPTLTSVMRALGVERATIATPRDSWPTATLANSDTRWPRATVDLTVNDSKVTEAIVDNVVLTHRNVHPKADAKISALLATQLKTTLDAARPNEAPKLPDILRQPPFKVEQANTISIKAPHSWIDASTLVRLLGGFNAKDDDGAPTILRHGFYVIVHRYAHPREQWLQSVELALP